MNIPLSWLKDFVDVSLPLEEIARVMTMCGLEIEEVRLVGLAAPQDDQHGFKFSGLAWSAEHFVVAEVLQVNPHPDADRLTLCQLDDGTGEHTILTGAPNLYPYKGLGRLEKPIKVAYIREGGVCFDGHKPGQELTKIKRTKIRGFETKSMVCSAKELGISEEADGILFLPSDAPVGMTLADYMGDAVFVVDILPNMARNACIRGVAREVAAQLGLPLKTVSPAVAAYGIAPDNFCTVEILEPELNPRFMAGFADHITVQPSPDWVQQRLTLAGMRPINAVVDATNYTMLELGQPLHAFDYDRLMHRVNGKLPKIITRRALAGEKLVTLDKTERTLDENAILVTDSTGILSIAGIMGGLEGEVETTTTRVLLESAAWNFIAIRKASTKLRINSEAAFRNARGVHPDLAETACELCLSRIAAWSGGQWVADIVDNYAKRKPDPIVTITEADIMRSLGLNLTLAETAILLERLEFECTIIDGVLNAKAPNHRLDIGEGAVGRADVLEEIARLYGYDCIPATRMADELPPAYSDPAWVFEDKLRDLLVSLGLQEIITYRFSSPEREMRLLGITEEDYVRLANPISPERNVMRRNLLVNCMEIVERNAHIADHIALFEIGPVFHPCAGQKLPQEEIHLAVALTGKRRAESWDSSEKPLMDFFDLKGIAEALLVAAHVGNVSFKPMLVPYLHPGKTAAVYSGDTLIGILGELHPATRTQYDLLNPPVVLMDWDIAALANVSEMNYKVSTVQQFPPILEDIAVVVDEDVTAEQLLSVIKQGGGKMLSDVRLFDIFRADHVGTGKKSMAYSLTYQSPERTLSDKDALAIRTKIIKRLEQVLGAKLRE